jgi:hypothetical protein
MKVLVRRRERKQAESKPRCTIGRKGSQAREGGVFHLLGTRTEHWSLLLAVYRQAASGREVSGGR